MKTKHKYFKIIAPLILLSLIAYIGCKPLQQFNRIPVYEGVAHYQPKTTGYDSSKKTIVIVASTEGTELFDLMAPFYLFNATQKANVYIVAEKKSPITLLKGAFVMPHLTFDEIDSLKIKPDVIVLPAMLKVSEDPNSLAQKWIKEKYDDKTKVLSICVGSLVGAATGIYDGKLLTTHASELSASKSHFKKPNWVNNIAVTQQGNVYSTAGVSNAVEGSLKVIKDLFDEETLHNVMNDIHYPYDTIKTAHQSLAVEMGNKVTIANKIFFKKNKNVGVLLQNGINEFAMAGILDTYNRTFPSSNETVTVNDSSIISKYGLTLYPTAKLLSQKLDELHILTPENFVKADRVKFEKTPIVTYSLSSNEYIFNTCLKRISEQYGSKFEHITKLLLDYN